MIIYNVFQYLLITIALVLIGYQLLLGLLALLPQRHKRSGRAAFNHSFLVVIHLRHKNQEILKTLYSLYSLVYPSNLFDLLIIADDYPEEIVKEARMFGAIVIEHNNQENKGKTDTLRWGLEQIGAWEEKYDAIVIIEPGGLVSGNFLEIMNYYLEGGSEILQSSNLKVAAPGRWRLKLMRTVGLLSTHINMLGRKKLGLGITLMGNGMCFRSKVLKNSSIDFLHTEDDLMSNISLLLKGVKVDFAPEAVVWSYLEDTPGKYVSDIISQKTGNIQIVKKYLSQFLNHTFIKRSLQDFDTLISLIMPSFLTLFLGTGVMAIINWGFWMLGAISISFFWVWLVLFCMTLIYLSIGVATDRAIFLDLSTSTDSRETVTSEY